jgi:hypothetical protein
MTAISPAQARALGLKIPPRRKASPLPRPMNREEAAFATRLATDPLVRFWAFEGVKLRLADRTFYTPDFLVAKRTSHHRDTESTENGTASIGGTAKTKGHVPCASVRRPQCSLWLCGETFLEVVEVKAFWHGKGGSPGRVGWREDSRVKWKCAAELYPCFRFVAAWREGGEWRFEVYGETSHHGDTETQRKHGESKRTERPNQ